jgi:anti-sigma28 factor (negative regulator of flagellin synthesis)
LKRRLEEGTYRLEGRRIAASMINEAVENNHILDHIDDDD